MFYTHKVSMALDATRGLQALHEAAGGPIVHFDIKPQQLMLDENGTVKLTDFNLCKYLDTDADGNTCPLKMSKSHRPGEGTYAQLWGDAKSSQPGACQPGGVLAFCMP